MFPWGSGSAASVNRVAVWQNSPADPFPAVIYALGDSTMFLSFDGGATWIRDKGALPINVGGLTSPAANFNSPKVMVISPRFPVEVFIAQNGRSGPDVLNRGDYSHFPLGDQTSSWDTLPLPDALNSTDTQDSGNIFLAVTQRGRGDLLFYGAQRWFEDIGKAAAYLGPLDPQSGSDWHPLGVVHVDLHGFLLSPDFERESIGLANQSGDRQSIGCTIKLWNISVCAKEEIWFRGNESADESVERRTAVRRHFLMEDEVWTLADQRAHLRILLQVAQVSSLSEYSHPFSKEQSPYNKKTSEAFPRTSFSSRRLFVTMRLNERGRPPLFFFRKEWIAA